MRADPARWRVRPPRAASGLRRVRGGSVREDGIWRECPPRASHGLQFLAWESSASSGQRPCSCRRSYEGRARSSGTPSRYRDPPEGHRSGGGHRDRSSPRNFFQAGDHPERGGLAASGRAQEHDELAVVDGKRHLLDRCHRVEILAEVLQEQLAQRVFSAVIAGNTGEHPLGELLLENLSKNFDTVAAVKEVSLSIHDGEFVVLLGPSGCGKTTTLRMIAGLEEITGGKIYLDGRLLNDVLPGDRDIAMVFQNYALYPHMTVYKNMAFGLRMRKTPRQEIVGRVKRAADILAISHLLERYPRELSGGQRQRVAVGRAIVRDPRAFLF